MAFPGNRTWKRAVNVNHLKVTGGPHAGYPLGLINVMPGDVYDIAQADGGDIRFTLDEAGTTKLPCEIVKFDPATDTCQIWVPVTVQNSGASTVWMWYGNKTPGQPMSQPVRNANPDADGFQGRDYVWDANFMLVVHCESSMADSSRYNRTPSNTAGAPSFSAQQVGNGSVWNNASVSSHGRITQLDTATQLTQECWALTTDSSLVYDFICGRRSDASPGGTFGLNIINASDRNCYFQVHNGSSWFTALASGLTLLNTRRYLAGFYKGSQHVRLRVDTTTFTNTSGIPASLPTNTVACTMGGYSSGSHTGTIDEYRLSNIDRGVDWTDTAQENMRNPATFVSFGSPISLGGPPAPKRVPAALLALLAA